MCNCVYTCMFVCMCLLYTYIQYCNVLTLYSDWEGCINNHFIFKQDRLRQPAIFEIFVNYNICSMSQIINNTSNNSLSTYCGVSNLYKYYFLICDLWVSKIFSLWRRSSYGCHWRSYARSVSIFFMSSIVAMDSNVVIWMKIILFA